MADGGFPLDAATEQSSLAHLRDSTSLLVRNAARFGDSDATPASVEYKLLERYSGEAGAAVWADDPPSVPLAAPEQTPVSELGLRTVHLVHPVAYLRLGGAIVSNANVIEKLRSDPRVSPAARAAVNGTRATLIQGRQYVRRDRAIRAICSEYPLILRTDVAACYPSMRPEVVVGPLPNGPGMTIVTELERFGIYGLPVGAVSWRWLAEVALSHVDHGLGTEGRLFVRHMDDFCIGVRNQRDAQRVISLLGQALADLGLTPNKSKTEVIPSAKLEFGLPAVTLHELRALLTSGKPIEKLHALSGLRRLRDQRDQLGPAQRADWTRTLVEALVVNEPHLAAMLRTIECLAGDGRVKTPFGPLRRLLSSALSVTRARAAEYLGRHRDWSSCARLTLLASGDSSPLVRREALLALVRMRDVVGVRSVLGAEPRTVHDRGMHFVAAGALGLPLLEQPQSAYEELLYEVAREHGAGGVLGCRRKNQVVEHAPTPAELLVYA